MSEYRAALESLWADPWEPEGGPLAKWLTAHQSPLEQCLRSVPQKQLAELLGISPLSLTYWVEAHNVTHVDGRTTRPIPGLVRPPAASDVKPPADVGEVGKFPGNNSGIKASLAGQDLTPPAAPPPAPAAQPPPRSIECWQAYVEGMKDALRLIFGVVGKGE